MKVWTLTFDAEGPEGGDYDGLRSVHATKELALLRLFDKVAELGVDPRSPEVQVIASADSEDGSTAGDLEANGWKISYGVHLSPVEGADFTEEESARLVAKLTLALGPTLAETALRVIAESGAGFFKAVGVG